MEVKATAKYVRVSPRKVRPILDLVRGRKVEEALPILRFLPSPTARLVAKVVKSAAANAENNFQLSPEELHIVKIYADEGPRLKRFRPKPRGRVGRIIKRSSHITVIVAEKES
jgi:large subunit ribosomal protein L22